MGERLRCGESVLNGPISAKCDMIERDLGSKSTQGVFFTVIPDHCEPRQIGFGAQRGKLGVR